MEVKGLETLDGELKSKVAEDVYRLRYYYTYSQIQAQYLDLGIELTIQELVILNYLHIETLCE